MTGFIDGVSRAMRTPAFKFFLVGGLILLLGIPLLLVGLLVYERSGRSSDVEHEIARDWGGAQTVQGPYLVVPYTVKIVTSQDGKAVEQVQERRAFFLPETLTVNGRAETSVKHRSIYDVTVYQAKLSLSGGFAAPDVAGVDSNVQSVRWQDSVLAFGIADVSGLKEASNLDIGGQKHAFEPSIGLPNNAGSGIHVKPFAKLKDRPAAFEFRTELAFNGTSSLQFAPVARTTSVTLDSNWPSPSFTGAFLPSGSKIADQGFSASWKVPHLARSVRQSWSETPSSYSSLSQFNNYMFGAKFFVPVDYYNLVTRAVKYAMLYILVTLCSMLVLELRSPVRVHAIQYLFAGIAMIMFYVLLLALAEHIGFTRAYMLAAGATGGMLSVYSAFAFASWLKGGAMAALFALLYGLLYMILRLEDYALLAGAVIGFFLITIGMFATLNVNWSSEKAAPQPQPS